MSKSLEELQKLFPSSKEIAVVDRKFVVKPMVMADFIAVIENFSKVVHELNKKGVKLTEFNENSDLVHLIPVINEVLGIFVKWLDTDIEWLKNNLTPKGTIKLLIEFLDVNEWKEVKQLFLEMMLKIQEEESKK